MQPVIDLGDVTTRPAGPQLDDPMPRLDRRLLRRLRVAAVAALCASTLVAAAVPAPPAVHVAWELPVQEQESIMMAGDSVVAQRMMDGQAVLTAHDIASGSTKWARPVGPDLGAVEFLPDAGLLLLRSDLATVERTFRDGESGLLMYYRETIALAPATGDRLWDRPGEPLAAGADGVLLEQRDKNGDFSSLSLVRAGDGQPLWSRPAPGVQAITIGYHAGRPHRVIMITKPGDITVLRYTDGEPVHSRPLPRYLPGEDVFLLTAGDRLLVVRTDTYQSTVTAYHLETLDGLWHTTTNSFPWILDCGEVLCLIDDHGLSALDPATGRTRWQMPGITSVAPAGTGRLLAGNNDFPPVQTLVDTADGRRIGPGGRGEIHSPPGDTGSVLLSRTTTTPVGHAILTRLDLDTGEPTVIGMMRSPTDFGCEVAERHLLCRDPGRAVVTATR
ncbi:outer membrane protein assembly factor BamB family protein [Actinoplanes aureus]|uniref:PQQ-binding-like beta-propeller repeat protein n=1 Tax=Actinoplanes aureus TaxID=2792083 RepID=A0A931CCP8_9ACTN|nr:PQQ-binding-like beta-propeller repeat protein [Actinoplanes aureus]MBG0564161.1 PQQ-binding-like beta-propeller repeat protein [Actinoplanes aureus]